MKNLKTAGIQHNSGMSLGDMLRAKKQLATVKRLSSKTTKPQKVKVVTKGHHVKRNERQRLAYKRKLNAISNIKKNLAEFGITEHKQVQSIINRHIQLNYFNNKREVVHTRREIEFVVIKDRKETALKKKVTTITEPLKFVSYA
tara:strand:- start:252 stop:683 length:432 start_codon:yes stop_codon:yes gene_type:complete